MATRPLPLFDQVAAEVGIMVNVSEHSWLNELEYVVGFAFEKDPLQEHALVFFHHKWDNANYIESFRSDECFYFPNWLDVLRQQGLIST